MKAYFHLGAEKTGSSYLQTVCVNGRKYLHSSGLHFPVGVSRHERRMGAGLVSAGNGFLISQCIQRYCYASVMDQMQCHRDAAISANSNAVFLTSELLLPAIAYSKGLELLEEAAANAGFTSTRYLIVLRDPIAQCLSLYKHRAKRGTAGEIADWVEKGYRLPQELRGFREQAEKLGITPTVRGYTREPGGLEKRFFEDWLGVPAPAVDMPATVNPSLTLSELILIKQMAERRPALVEPLYDALLTIDPAEKVQGSALEAHAKAVATAAVAAHADEWAAWNRLLPADEALPIPAPPADILPRPRELGLTDRQMAALAAVVDEAASSRFVARLIWRSRIRPVLSRLKRGWRR